MTVELREHVSDAQRPASTTLFGMAATDATGYFRIVGARTTSLRIEIQSLAGYQTPVSVFYPSLCVGRVNRIKPMHLSKNIAGLSIASSATVSPGPLTVTWQAMEQAAFYCVQFADAATNASVVTGSCETRSPATRITTTSFTTPSLASGRTYRLTISAGMGTTEVGNGFAQITVR